MPNPNDAIRDAILRYLYDRHQHARGPKGVAVQISELQSAMKERGIARKEVNSNLDYLIQKGWIREVVTSRRFTTPGGTQVERPTTTYKISDVGIDLMESASAFKRDDLSGRANVTNIHGVTVIGTDNVVVNTQYSDVYRALDDLEAAVSESTELDDANKLSALADLEGLKAQLAKPTPNRAVVAQLWSGIEKVVVAGGLAELLHRASQLIAPLVS
jgi:hypothetical protein